jgi:hypothetical protein
MQITLGRLLSLLIAIGYAVLVISQEGGLTETGVKVCVSLLLPLALIWFPEELGSMTGYVGRGGNIDTETPPILVSIMGWCFLVGLPLLMYLLG